MTTKTDDAHINAEKVIGVIGGAIPGMSATMAVALTLQPCRLPPVTGRPGVLKQARRTHGIRPGHPIGCGPGLEGQMTRCLRQDDRLPEVWWSVTMAS